MNDSSSIQLGQLSVRYLHDGSQTGSVGMFELSVPPGSNVPPPHSHTMNDECVYVLEGTLRYSVDAESRDLAAGEFMFSPKGSVHQFSNPFAVPVRALVVQSPDIGAQYFRDVRDTAPAGGGPPDKAAMMAVMSRYGLVPAAPQRGS